MKHFDTFSGCGGFTLAFDQFKAIETIGASEIDKYALSVYKFHFPGVKQYGDINKITIEELPDFDLLTGGTPCQDLSIAGQRRGISASRSGLFFRWCEIIKAKTPKFVIWENVKGALSSNGGLDYLQVLHSLASCGYDLQWGVVNAKWFVPQNRERIFIVGHLRGTTTREVFPIRGEIETTPVVGEEISNCLDAHYSKGLSVGGQQGLQRQVVGTDIAYTIDANYYKGPSPSSVKNKKRQLLQVNNPTHSNDRVFRVEGISPTLNTMQGGRRQPLLTDGVRLRRMTPLECERVMGYPDGWTRYGIEKDKRKNISDTQRYKMLGNSLVPQVVSEIIRRA